VANPGPVFYGLVRGWLTDVATLRFQVWSTATTPAQVYPDAGYATVNVTTDRIGKGRFAAPWTVSGALPEGAYRIRWFYRWTADGPELSTEDRVEVVASNPADGPFYTVPSDLIAEGATGVTTPRMLTAIARASEQLDMFTRTWFDPRYLELQLDARGGALLHLQHAIIGIEAVELNGAALAADELVLYARHMDGSDDTDRKNPKIARTGPWPSRGTVSVRGVFGTRKRRWEAGPAWGMTPPMAMHATRLLALRELPLVADADAASVAKSGGKIQSESTRDQSVTYAPAAGQSGRSNAPPWYTGDPEIDQLIHGLRGPLFIGAT
jgi:hypothetical protein